MTWQHDGLMVALGYFEGIIVDRLENEGVSMRKIERRETLTGYLLEALRKFESWVTPYTALDPTRLPIDIEKLYDGVKKEVLNIIKVVRKQDAKGANLWVNE